MIRPLLLILAACGGSPQDSTADTDISNVSETDNPQETDEASHDYPDIFIKGAPVDNQQILEAVSGTSDRLCDRFEDLGVSPENVSQCRTGRDAARSNWDQALAEVLAGSDYTVEDYYAGAIPLTIATHSYGNDFISRDMDIYLGDQRGQWTKSTYDTSDTWLEPSAPGDLGMISARLLQNDNTPEVTIDRSFNESSAHYIVANASSGSLGASGHELDYKMMTNSVGGGWRTFQSETNMFRVQVTGETTSEELADLEKMQQALNEEGEALAEAFANLDAAAPEGEDTHWYYLP
jgi:hypothetical protein